jgi:hypothetical protein
MAAPRTKPKPLPTGLELRGLCYYAVRDVPRPLQAAVGKRRLVKSLRTRNLTVALATRHAAQVEFQRQIDAADRAVNDAPEVAAGLAWREQFKALERGDLALIRQWGGEGREMHTVEGTWQLTTEEAAGVNMDEDFNFELESIAETYGPEAAAVMRGLATGTATPLLFHVDSWLAEGGSKGPGTPRTQRQYRSDLTALADWLKTINVTTIEAVTKKTVGRYVTEGLLGRGMDRVTANRKISAPSAYWRWLIRRGHAETSPWTGQSLSKGAGRGHRGQNQTALHGL